MARSAGGEKERECPKCRSRLHERRIQDAGVKVDCCPSCRGLWFDNRELEAVLELQTGERFVPRTARKSDRRCPRCGILLFGFRYPETDVEIDMCETCHGIWLDSGELKRFEDMFASPRWGFLRFLEKVLAGLTP